MSEDLSRFRRQVSVRLDQASDRDMREIQAVTHEDPSVLIRRLLREEYGRKVLGVKLEERERG